MTTWIVVGLAAGWLVVGATLALVLGRMTRIAEEREPDDEEVEERSDASHRPGA